MSCCSSNSTSKKMRQDCPECGGSCLSVALKTMLLHVQFPGNQHITEGDYFYCPSMECNTGYFSSSTFIPKQQLRAFKPHRQKMLCYCFDISESLYLSALESGVSEPIKTFVVRQTKSGSCACEVRNPSGRCCLADFKRREKSYELT
ncbi:hypothetical protein MMIC_P1637 [Mariprofundus micogutta]|uniref:CopZ zinc binding domain-containing protein n=2 Tax=Mariprofundus micogutta TaxID=1921010 RepID=A0A1L8CP14_9PROT|nr:hypothetical protein MMIC_P1637 [Mariprofundus micogutta]